MNSDKQLGRLPDRALRHQNNLNMSANNLNMSLTTSYLHHEKDEKLISCAWTSLSVNTCTAAEGSCRIRDFAAKHKQSPSKSTNPFPTYQCCHYGEEIQSSEKRRELSKSSWWFKSVIVTSAMYCDMSTKTTEFMLDELSQLEEEYGVSVVQLQGS